MCVWCVCVCGVYVCVGRGGGGGGGYVFNYMDTYAQILHLNLGSFQVLRFGMGMTIHACTVQPNLNFRLAVHRVPIISQSHSVYAVFKVLASFPGSLSFGDASPIMREN